MFYKTTTAGAVPDVIKNLKSLIIMKTLSVEKMSKIEGGIRVLSKKVTLLFIITSFILISCGESELQEVSSRSKDLSLLKGDDRFVNLISKNISVIDNMASKKIAQNLLEKGDLTTDELQHLSRALGFENLKTYQKFIEENKRIYNELSFDYDLSNVNRNEFVNYALQAQIFKTPGNLKESPCERIRRNCLVQTAAEAVIAHLACASVDWTGIGAPVCHGAVLIYQIAASDNCNANAEICNNQPE